MSSKERTDLAQLVRRRERLAKADAGARAAELRADVEEQLATEYDPLDAMWREQFEEAEQAVQELNAELAPPLRGVRHPWPLCAVGAHALAEPRRELLGEATSELRKVAESRIAFSEKAAKAEIERRSVEVQTALVAGGLESAEARAFLESMPSAAGLMPQLTVAEIEAG